MSEIEIIELEEPTEWDARQYTLRIDGEVVDYYWDVSSVSEYGPGEEYSITEEMKESHARLIAQAPEMQEEIIRLREQVDAMARERYEIDQILGKALGYPEYTEDFGAPKGDVCTGEHVPVTLAREAAKRIEELKKNTTRRN